MTDKTTGMPPMIGRALTIAEWLQYVAGYDFGPVAPSKAVLHHTLSPTIEQWRGLASMKGMQTFYRGKGWTAAPHIYVGPEAGPNIWLFTPMADIGVHANAGNSGHVGGKLWYSIGVEMVGDYDKSRPSGQVWDGTKAVLGGLSLRLGISPRQLMHFHREYNTTKSCPGWAVGMDWVVSELESWLHGRSLPTDPTPAVQGTRYVVRPKTAAIIRIAPNTSAQIIERRTAGQDVWVVGTQKGQLAGGSTLWYMTREGYYVHESAVTKA